jgi:gamma-glutamyltranspeptidase
MVSLTSSLLSGFGSGIVVDKGGFFMNDRMRYYYLDPKDVNSLQPGKRVRQTINPAMALKDGKPWIAFGTPGADTQPQTQAAVLPQRRGVRPERAGSAGAADGDQQQLPRFVLSSRRQGQAADAGDALESRPGARWRRRAISWTSATSKASDR